MPIDASTRAHHANQGRRHEGIHDAHDVQHVKRAVEQLIDANGSQLGGRSARRAPRANPTQRGGAPKPHPPTAFSPSRFHRGTEQGKRTDPFDLSAILGTRPGTGIDPTAMSGQTNGPGNDADPGDTNALTNRPGTAVDPVDMNAQGTRPGTAVDPMDMNRRVSIDVADVAQRYAGGRYVYGGGRDGRGFGVPGQKNSDCSAFVSAVWAERGMPLAAHTDGAYNQLKNAGAPTVPLSEARPGDVVFYMGAGTGGAISHHVGIYAGDGKVLDQSSANGGGVQLRDVNHGGRFEILRDPRVG